MQRYRLDSESELVVWPAWLPPDDAAKLCRELSVELAWEQRSVQIFGRWVPQPRLIAWAGEIPYRYSGLELAPAPLPARVSELLCAVNELTHVAFNHVLLNRYRDGNDSMGWHSDDEPELGRQPPIASVSLGATRDFLVRPRGKGAERRVSIALGPGDLLLMTGATQHRYVHSLPKRKAAAEERISLTFRRVLRAPS